MISLRFADRSLTEALKGLPVREMKLFGSMNLLVSRAVVDLSPLADLPLKSL